MEIPILLLLVVLVALVRYGHADDHDDNNNNTGNDDHADDYNVDNMFNPCETADAFDISASFMDPFVDGGSVNCSEVVMFQEMGINASSTCNSDMYVFGWNETYPLGNLFAWIGGEGCCTDGVASCTDNGNGLGPKPDFEDDDDEYDDNNTGNDDTAEPFNPCAVTEDFLPDHAVGDDGLTCGSWATFMTYGGIVEDSQCDETIDDVSVTGTATSMFNAGCCGSGENKCASGSDGEYFNVCMNPDDFLPDFEFSLGNTTSTCGEYMGLMTYIGFNDSSSCSDVSNGLELGSIAYSLHYAGCCGSENDGARCGDDDGNDDVDYADMWNPCGNVTDFMPDALFDGPGDDDGDDGDDRRRLVAHAMSKMTMSPVKAPYGKMAARVHDDDDDGEQMSCGDMISFFDWAGVDECDSMIPDSEVTLGQMSYWIHTSCCANPTTSAKTCEPEMNNYCANPDDFNSDGDISGLTGEEGATCESFSMMMTMMGVTPESQCSDAVMMGDDDYDDDDDGPNTVGEMYMMLSAFGCCSGNAHKCLTPTYSLVDTYTKECGYPRNPARRMHPHDMKTTLIAVDFSVNATGDVGIIFAADAEMDASEHVRIRVKALEFEFFAKTRENKHMVHPVNLKRYREKFIHKFVEVHSMSDLEVMDRAHVEGMVPSVIDMGTEDMNFYRAPLDLGGVTQDQFEQYIRQARIEVQRKMDMDGPWQVDHCMKMPSHTFVANMMLQGDDDDHDHDDDNHA